jgi:thymidylate kinase
MKIVAIEGLCFAGKTTLAVNLSAAFLGAIVLPDYADVSSPERHPEVPALSPLAELRAFEYYLSLDALRWSGVSEGSQSLVLLDRSVHTLLAHIYSNDKRTRFDVFPPASALTSVIAESRRANVVLYLDVAEETLSSRYYTIPNKLPALFKTVPYMRGFREYFMNSGSLAPPPVIINANQTPRAVADEAVRVLSGMGIC